MSARNAAYARVAVSIILPLIVMRNWRAPQVRALGKSRIGAESPGTESR